MGIEKLFFLLAMAIGFLFGAAFLRVWSDRERSLGAVRPWLAPDWMAVLLSVIFVVLLVEAYVHMESSAMRYGRRPLPVEHPIVLTVALGLMTGVAGRWFLLATNHETPTAGLLARGAPVALLFAMGFLSQDMRRIVDSLTSVDAFGVALQFDAGKATKQDGFPDFGATGLEPYGTDFELGVLLANFIVSGAARDRKTLREFCSYQHKLFDCTGWSRHVDSFKEDSESHRRIIQKNWIRLAESESFVRNYSPFVKCISEQYVVYFPAGLPIQPILNGIAAEMIIPQSIDGPTHNVSSLSASLHHFIKYRKRFDNFDKNDEEDCLAFVIPPEAYNLSQEHFSKFPIPEEKLNKIGDREKTLNEFSIVESRNDQWIVNLDNLKSLYPDPVTVSGPPRTGDDQGNHDAAADWRETVLRSAKAWSDGVSVQTHHRRARLDDGEAYGFLHVPVLEAAVITAAGYPSEAAAHLRREMKLHQRSVPGAAGDEPPTDFGSFLFKTKAMYALNLIYQRLELRDEQYMVNEAYIAELETFLKRAVGMSASAPADVVRWCVKHQPMIEALVVDGEPSRALMARQERFLLQVIDVYLRQKLALIRAYAERKDRGRDDGISTTLLAAAEDINRLVTGERAVLERCLGELYKDASKPQNVERSLQRLSFDALAVYGLLQISLGHDLRSVEGMETSPQVRKLYCGAAATLRDAVRLSTMRIADEALVSDNESLLRRIKPLAAELRPTLAKC